MTAFRLPSISRLPAILAIVCFASRAACVADEPSTIRWKSVAFLSTLHERPEGKKGVVGSAFLAVWGEKRFLITAQHCADDTNPTTKVTFVSDKKTVQLRLEDLQAAASGDWLYQPGYDLAATVVSHPLLSSAHALDLVTTPAASPPIKTNLEIVGFPLALGGQNTAELSPVVIEADTASRVMADPFTGERKQVFIAAPGALAGTSGGPVFGELSPGDWRLVGLFSGGFYDKRGASLSKIVPIEAVRSLVAAHSPTPRIATDANEPKDR